jgi:hypothetical protein
MTDYEIDQLIAEIDEMAQRIGCRFIPDPDRLMDFRCSQREMRSYREEYEQALRADASRPCKC